MKVTKTELADVYVIEPQVFGDKRGWFMESYVKAKLAAYGVQEEFVQDNHSFSAARGTLRGLHCQIGTAAQGKIVRCTRGAIYDVAVDLRRGSPQYKQWIGVALSAENKKQLYIPRGFGHGFVTITDNVEVQYKADAYYDAACDRSIAFDDPAFAVEWGAGPFILSDKDRQAPLFKDSDINFAYERA